VVVGEGLSCTHPVAGQAAGDHADLRSVMDRIGHTLIQTTQKYLHALPDADQRNLDAFRRIAGPPPTRRYDRAWRLR